MKPQKIKLQLVMSTGQSIGSLLFNNKVKEHGVDGSRCTSLRCHVCSENLRENDQLIVSPTNGRSYPVNKSLSCTDRGIYSITCAAHPCTPAKHPHHSHKGSLNISDQLHQLYSNTANLAQWEVVPMTTLFRFWRTCMPEGNILSPRGSTYGMKG